MNSIPQPPFIGYLEFISFVVLQDGHLVLYMTYIYDKKVEHLSQVRPIITLHPCGKSGGSKGGH